jgi:hypothetical protein
MNESWIHKLTFEEFYYNSKYNFNFIEQPLRTFIDIYNLYPELKKRPSYTIIIYT